MSAPATLRQLAGLPAVPAKLADAVLVLVDCQNTYRRGPMQLTGVEPALQACRTLLLRARELGASVIHVQHDGGAGSAYDIAADAGRIADEVAPVAGEPVVVKRRPNSFVGTDLEARLRALGARDLVLCGFMTHMCINSTARGAFNLGFAPTIVAPATATRALPVPGGGVLPASAVHDAALAAVADLFAVVVDEVAAV